MMNKIRWIAFSPIALLLSACDQQGSPAGSKTSDDSASSATVMEQPVVPIILDSDDQRASYGIGYRMGSSVRQDENLRADRAALIAGIEDGLSGRQGQLEEAEIQRAGKVLEERGKARTAAINESKLGDAKAFLQRNAQRPGVEVSDSGLQSEVLSSPSDSNAPKPSSMDTVEVHYHGTLTDGTVFDSSIERGESISLAVRSAIPGWVEALQLMRVGEKRRVVIPPALGYGSSGAGSVPPNAVLLFDLELLNVTGRSRVK